MHDELSTYFLSHTTYISSQHTFPHNIHFLTTQAQEFAQSKGKARKEGMTNVRFTDVAGIDTVRDELMEIVNVGGDCLRVCMVCVFVWFTCLLSAHSRTS